MEKRIIDNEKVENMEASVSSANAMGCYSWIDPHVPLRNYSKG